MSCFKSERPRVLVLLATYNGYSFLEEQLASIATQLNVDISIAISDDVSSDGSLPLFIKFCEDNNVSYSIVSSDKRFGSSAANFLHLLSWANASEFDYVALCDQDDIWLPTKLSTAVSEMSESGASGLSSSLIIYHSDCSLLSHLLIHHKKQSEYSYLANSASAGCTYVLSSSGLTAVQSAIDYVSSKSLVSRLMSHDLFIYQVVRFTGLTWCHSKRARVLYRQHSSNSWSASSSSVLAFRLRLKLLRSKEYLQSLALTYSYVFDKVHPTLTHSLPSSVISFMKWHQNPSFIGYVRSLPALPLIYPGFIRPSVYSIYMCIESLRSLFEKDPTIYK